MDVETLQDFFFWCMVVNGGVYAFTAVATMVFRDFICSINRKLLGIDEETSRRSMQSYLATYKLLITVFNFTPWVAILIIK
jgi:hypothetical protein